MRTRHRWLAATALGLLALATVRAQQASPAPAAAPTGTAGLVEGGEAPDLFLIHTGDVIGYVDPCG